MKQLPGGAVKVGALPAVRVPNRRDEDQARYGVGEVIKLLPQQSLPTGRGPATWHLKSGEGEVEDLGDNQANYTAGDLGETQFLANTRSYDANLELRDARGVLAEVKLTVIAPDSCGLLKLGPRHRQGSANSGFWGQVVIGPNDVSFMNIVMQETRGTINADGVHAAEKGRIHADTGAWVPTSKVTAAGTLIGGADKVWSAAQEEPNGGWVPGNDRVVGNFVWDIAWMYRMASDDPATKGLQFGKAWHKAKTLASGRVTVEKGGGSHTADINDPTENFQDACPLPLL